MRRVVSRCRILLPLLALAMSACQTTEDGPAAMVTNTWSPAPLARADDGRGARANGAPLLGSPSAGKTTFLEGSGRFVGDRQSTPRQPAAASGEQGVTLNLFNVPAPQAAKTILGDILAVRYTIDPSIEGKITIQTPRPVARSEVIELFQTALRANNAAIIPVNGAYRIVPADQAAVGAAFLIPGAPETGERLGSGLRIVQLKYVTASEIRRVLEPIAPRGGVVRVDDARNIITLSGNSQEIEGMMEAISIFDVDVMQGMSFALVPVRTSEPGAIADELKTVFASEREGPTAGMVRFIPNKRLHAILVITAQPAYLRRAETWVRRLDAQAAGSEKQFFTYSVQNRRAQELVDVLQSMFSTETSATRGSKGRNVAPPYQEATVQSRGAQQPQKSYGATGASFGSGTGAGGLLSTLGGQGSTGSLQGRSLASPAAASSTRGSEPGTPIEVGRDEATGDPRVKIAADEAKNAILIEASQADYRRVMRLIYSLDVLPNQVLIEATIAEISLNDQLKFGLRWFLKGKSANYTFTNDASGAVSSVFPGFSYALTAANIAATLNALDEITSVNVLSSPSLTVMDNRTAILQIGDQVPITTQSAVSVLVTGAPIVNSVSYRDTGVILAMTPRINESGRVLLDIEQEVSNVASTTTSGIDSPTIRQRRIRTSVVVNNGEALALGGMIQDSRTLSSSQIPILGDIPVVGNLFRNRGNQIGKTELIVIITPHVIRNLSEARQITDEFRRELAINVPRDRRRTRTIKDTVRRTFE